MAYNKQFYVVCYENNNVERPSSHLCNKIYFYY